MKMIHTITSHDDITDTANVEVILEPARIEINIADDAGKKLHGAEVDLGYTRTVRIEVKEGTMKILIYGACTDDPTILDMDLTDEKPRMIE